MGDRNEHITPKDAEESAIVYIMVETIQAYDLNIFKYLNHLLERLLHTKMINGELAGLTPLGMKKSLSVVLGRCKVENLYLDI